MSHSPRVPAPVSGVARTAVVALAAASLMTACASGANPGARSAAYKVGSSSKALSAAAASRDPAVIRRAEARAARTPLPSAGSRGNTTRQASRSMPARTATAKSAAQAQAPRKGAGSAALATSTPAFPTPTPGVSAAPEQAVAQRIAIQRPSASGTSAPARALQLTPWSDRLWLLAALAVLALALSAAWVLRPRRRPEEALRAKPPVPTAANDVGEPVRRTRRADPPPPTVTILAARS